MGDSRQTTNFSPWVTAVTALAAPPALAHFVSPPGGVAFSQEGFTVLAFLVGSLVAAIVTIFNLLLAEKQERIVEWKRLAERGTDFAERAVEHATKVRES